MSESAPVPRFLVEDVNGKVTLHEAILVRRKASWRYYRSPDGADEWKENGDHWFASPEQAFRRFITSLFPSPDRALVSALCGGPTPEEDFRLLVQACSVLWRHWQETRKRMGVLNDDRA